VIEVNSAESEGDDVILVGIAFPERGHYEQPKYSNSNYIRFPKINSNNNNNR
jgi:hypothetical protein